MTNMIFASIFLALFGLSSQTSNCWHDIKPLRTTRAEVERILGPPVPLSKALDAAIYRTEGERVSVLYSTGPCSVQPSNGWSAPLGTVISVSVEPTVKPTLASLALDESKFEKHQDREMSDITHFMNEVDGISLEVNSAEGVVDTFRYFPTLKEARLRCDPSP